MSHFGNRSRKIMDKQELLNMYIHDRDLAKSQGKPTPYLDEAIDKYAFEIAELLPLYGETRSHNERLEWADVSEEAGYSNPAAVELLHKALDAGRYNAWIDTVKYGSLLRRRLDKLAEDILYAYGWDDNSHAEVAIKALIMTAASGGGPVNAVLNIEVLHEVVNQFDYITPMIRIYIKDGK